MPASELQRQITLDEVLDALDLQAKRAEQAGPRSNEYWCCKRRHPRYVFRCECMVRFLVGYQVIVASLPGCTRNLSRKGLSIVVRRPFRTGEAIEVELRPPNRAAKYLAGVVRFSKYAGGGYYEVGVELEAASNAPIFSRNPLLAMDAYPWLRGPAVPQ